MLGSCWLHGEVEFGARRLQELEPLSAGGFLLLSNIYAAANLWVDIFAIRDQIKDKGLRKIPGRSWI